MTGPPPTSGGSARDGWRLAVGTLTILPVPPPGQVTTRTAGTAMLLAPLVGVGLAGVLALAHLGVTAIQVPPALAAAAAVAALALLTRGLHLDGLADTVDGLALAGDRERSLATMRRGDTGPMGVAALVLVLLVQVSALGTLLPTAGGTSLAVAAVTSSRLALPWACRRGIPAARGGGLGATVAGSVPVAALAVVSAATTAGAIALVSYAAQTAPLSRGWPAGAVLAVLATGAGAAVVGHLVVRRSRRRLGGITGDVLGAVVELTLAAGLAVAAIAVGGPSGG